MVATIDDVRIDMRFTAIGPIHHGSGTQGNTALLRTEPVVQPDGRIAHVPFISGSSIRHIWRDAIWRHVARTVGLDDQLGIGEVALLTSGGALSEPGAKVNLDRLRRCEDLMPGLMMMGFSSRNDIITSTLRQRFAVLVCAENRAVPGKLPPCLMDDPHAFMSCDELVAETFGTRHDPFGGPADRLLADSGMFDAPHDPIQMIFDHQVIISGAKLASNLWIEAGTEPQLDALATAIAHATADGTINLAAKRASGFGTCSVEFDAPDGVLSPGRVERCTERISTRKTEIRDLIRELAG